MTITINVTGTGTSEEVINDLKTIITNIEDLPNYPDFLTWAGNITYRSIRWTQVIVDDDIKE